MSGASEEPAGEENLTNPETLGASQGSSRRIPSASESDARKLRSIALQMPCIGQGLFISGFGGVTNAKILEKQGITHILTLAKELKDATFPEGIQVRCVELRDSENEDLLPWFPELVEHVHDIIADGGRICVSCVAGVSRSASVCLAYKVRYEGCSLREAYEEVLKARPVISPNLGFWQALLKWEMEVRQDSSVVMQPFICGMVPDLESYTAYTQMRINIGWMDELLVMWSFHCLLFLLQVIALVWV